MPTLLEYFNNDFSTELSIDKTLIFTFHKTDEDKNIISEDKFEVIERIRQNVISSVRVFSYYIPLTQNLLGFIGHILDNLGERIKESNNLVVYGKLSYDIEVGEHISIYANRIYIYTEDVVDDYELKQLEPYCKDRKILLIIRGLDYVKIRMETEKPKAFISHDSRDKELIARPLSNGLNSRLCFVWYDEYSLKVGDSLRESIENGIITAHKCILILTKNYLNNPGWGKKEFNSIFTREMITNERVVLPIWYGVTKEEVYNYSPSLADTFALHWPTLENKSEDEYKQEVELLISKIHAAITI
jgi:hypothetical protein